MKTLFIVDIDATISDATERIKRAGPEPSREDRVTYETWANTINHGMALDKPVPGMLALVKAVADDLNNTVAYLTSREERHRNTTVLWLDRTGYPLWCPLIMRPDNDYLDYADLKEYEIERMAALHECSAVVVIDDDAHCTLEAVCDRRGWTFLKARSGGVLK